MKVINSFTFLVGILVFCVVSAEENVPSCEIEGVNWSWWSAEHIFETRDNVDDNYVGIVHIFNVTKNVKSATMKSSKYIECKFENDEIIVSTTKKIADFEKDEKEMFIKEGITITCLHEGKQEADDVDKEYTFHFQQRLNDINTYTPKFSKDNYKFEYFSSLKRYDKITEMQKITVTDLDMSSTEWDGLRVEIEENEFFRIQMGSPHASEKRTSYVHIEPMQDIQPPFNKIFTITTTDTGKPEVKSSTAKVEVILHEEETIIFTESLYIAGLEDKEVLIENGPIAIENGKDSETNFEITSELGIEDSFKVTQDIDTITLVLTKPLNETIIEGKDFAFLTLNAEHMGKVGHCAVLLLLTDKHKTTDNVDDDFTEESTGIQSELGGFQDWIWGSSFLLYFVFGILTVVMVIVIVSYRKLWLSRE